MEKGARVGAILDSNEKVVRFLGYGIYEGDQQVPAEVNEELAEIGLKNPRIKLDNGNVVYGFQCWWDSEERIKKVIADKTVVLVEFNQT